MWLSPTIDARLSLCKLPQQQQICSEAHAGFNLIGTQCRPCLFGIFVCFIHKSIAIVKVYRTQS